MSAPAGTRCHYCGGQATHFCSGCGHYICLSAKCNIQAAADAGKRLTNAASSAASSMLDAASRALGFKP